MKKHLITFLTVLIFALSFASVNAGTDEDNLVTYSEYDFVPGDELLYYEDFSGIAVGKFPLSWATNVSGEVKTVKGIQGNWLHLNGEDAMYCLKKNIKFPANFIVEFDIIPDSEYTHGIIFTLYADPENKEIDEDLYPGKKGLHIIFGNEIWETQGYDNDRDSTDWLVDKGKAFNFNKGKVNHITIWVQNPRVRIYHGGKKIIDMNKNIWPGTDFNRLRFSGWDRASWPHISNIKILSAAPDTRTKLLKEGKLISYGIYFDSGKDVVKAESFGTLKEIAEVMKENPSIRIKIVGHTDSDGDDAMNLDLSRRRADNVKEYLENQFKIDANRMEVEGKGETQPITKNDTPENKAKNRRVEFIKL
ncbi:MAG: OmpA family protein [bacterium]|nr:OmpA family protein [bacterium]